MTNKLISIITVSFNAASTIEVAIESVRKNKSPQTEYIIIDGGSNDGTVDLLKKHNESIDKWISEPDLGIYDAMNKGVAIASGKWVMFLGADDLLCSNISEIERAFEPGLNYYGSVRLRSCNTIYDGKFNRYKILQKNICQQAFFYCIDVLREKKFNTRYEIAADYEMNLFLFGSQISKVKYIDKVIADFNDCGISSIRTDKRFRANMIFIFLRHFPAYLYPMYFIARSHYYMSRLLHHAKKLRA